MRLVVHNPLTMGDQPALCASLYPTMGGEAALCASVPQP